MMAEKPNKRRPAEALSAVDHQSSGSSSQSGDEDLEGSLSISMFERRSTIIQQAKQKQKQPEPPADSNVGEKSAGGWFSRVRGGSAKRDASDKDEPERAEDDGKNGAVGDADSESHPMLHSVSSSRNLHRQNNVETIPDFETVYHEAIRDHDWDGLEVLLKDYDFELYKKPSQAPKKKQTKKLRVAKYLPELPSFRKEKQVPISPFLGLDALGRTPLHLCCVVPVPSKLVIRVLNSARDAAAVKDQTGSLPLHLAVANERSVDVIDRLVRGFFPGSWVGDGRGRTPLAWAVEVARKKQETENFKRTGTYWGFPVSPEDVSWQERQVVVWELAHFLVQNREARHKKLLISEHELIVTALREAAPPEVISLMISIGKDAFKKEELAGKSISLLISRQYSIDLLQKLLDVMPQGFAKLHKDMSGRGVVASHYRIGCTSLSHKRDSFRVTMQKLANAKNDLQKDFTPPAQYLEWWEKLKFLINLWGTYVFDDSGDQKDYFHEDELLLHNALMNPDVPPSLVQLLALLFPDSPDLEHPQSNALPIHLACRIWRYREYPPRRGEKEISLDRVTLQLIESNPTKTRKRYRDRLPIHHAIATAKTWKFVKPLVTHDRKSLQIRDPETKLYPFQMAAMNNDTLLDLTAITRQSFAPSVWNKMRDYQQDHEMRKVQSQVGHLQLGLIYELLRHSPDAISRELLLSESAAKRAAGVERRLVSDLREASDEVVSITQMKLVRAMFGLGNVAGHFIGWCYENSARGWKTHRRNLAVLKESIMDGFVPIAMDKWWKKLKFWLWQDCPWDSIPRRDDFLLHGALCNPDVSPWIIELLLECFPRSAAIPLPNSNGCYPLHIACLTSSYIPLPFEFLNERNVIEMVAKAFHDAILLKWNNQLPLHLAIAKSKHWDEMRFIAESEPVSLAVPETETNFFAFQYMALHRPYTRVQGNRFEVFAMKEVGKEVWKKANPEEKVVHISKVLARHEAAVLESIFELLRRNPILVSVGVMESGNGTSAIFDTKRSEFEIASASVANLSSSAWFNNLEANLSLASLEFLEEVYEKDNMNKESNERNQFTNGSATCSSSKTDSQQIDTSLASLEFLEEVYGKDNMNKESSERNQFTNALATCSSSNTDSQQIDTSLASLEFLEEVYGKDNKNKESSERNQFANPSATCSSSKTDSQHIDTSTGPATGVDEIQEEDLELDGFVYAEYEAPLNPDEGIEIDDQGESAQRGAVVIGSLELRDVDDDDGSWNEIVATKHCGVDGDSGDSQVSDVSDFNTMPSHRLLHQERRKNIILVSKSSAFLIVKNSKLTSEAVENLSNELESENSWQAILRAMGEEIDVGLAIGLRHKCEQVFVASIPCDHSALLIDEDDDFVWVLCGKAAVSFIEGYDFGVVCAITNVLSDSDTDIWLERFDLCETEAGVIHRGGNQILNWILNSVERNKSAQNEGGKAFAVTRTMMRQSFSHLRYHENEQFYDVAVAKGCRSLIFGVARQKLERRFRRTKFISTRYMIPRASRFERKKNEFYQSQKKVKFLKKLKKKQRSAKAATPANLKRKKTQHLSGLNQPIEVFEDNQSLDVDDLFTDPQHYPPANPLLSAAIMARMQSEQGKYSNEAVHLRKLNQPRIKSDDDTRSIDADELFYSQQSDPPAKPFLSAAIKAREQSSQEMRMRRPEHLKNANQPRRKHEDDNISLDLDDLFVDGNDEPPVKPFLTAALEALEQSKQDRYSKIGEHLQGLNQPKESLDEKSIDAEDLFDEPQEFPPAKPLVAAAMLAKEQSMQDRYTKHGEHLQGLNQPKLLSEEKSLDGEDLFDEPHEFPPAKPLVAAAMLAKEQSMQDRYTKHGEHLKGLNQPKLLSEEKSIDGEDLFDEPQEFPAAKPLVAAAIIAREQAKQPQYSVDAVHLRNMNQPNSLSGEEKSMDFNDIFDDPTGPPPAKPLVVAAIMAKEQAKQSQYSIHAEHLRNMNQPKAPYEEEKSIDGDDLFNEPLEPPSRNPILDAAYEAREVQRVRASQSRGNGTNTGHLKYLQQPRNVEEDDSVSLVLSDVFDPSIHQRQSAPQKPLLAAAIRAKEQRDREKRRSQRKRTPRKRDIAVRKRGAVVIVPAHLRDAIHQPPTNEAADDDTSLATADVFDPPQPPPSAKPFVAAALRAKQGYTEPGSRKDETPSTVPRSRKAMHAGMVMNNSIELTKLSPVGKKKKSNQAVNVQSITNQQENLNRIDKARNESKKSGGGFFARRIGKKTKVPEKAGTGKNR